jgi:hypothetical protein
MVEVSFKHEYEPHRHTHRHRAAEIAEQCHPDADPHRASGRRDPESSIAVFFARQGGSSGWGARSPLGQEKQSCLPECR